MTVWTEGTDSLRFCWQKSEELTPDSPDWNHCKFTANVDWASLLMVMLWTEYNYWRIHLYVIVPTSVATSASTLTSDLPCCTFSCIQLPYIITSSCSLQFSLTRLLWCSPTSSKALSPSSKCLMTSFLSDALIFSLLTKAQDSLNQM